MPPLDDELACPNLKRHAPDAYRALAALTRSGHPDHTVSELVKLRASQMNDCRTCQGIHTDLMERSGETPERIAAVADWRGSERFSPAERAALALAEEVTRGPLTAGTATEVGRHFGEDGLSRLVATALAINAWNRATLASEVCEELHAGVG